ncbi:MAG TPA: chromosome segregation protein SMC [Clostridiales bacterium]|nr:chromosome segregation protein SMC [Clostridiales bacterium]
MHLKRLDIQGFKSFSDRTTLDFDPGITSIVGPNGCGKSNIVDAIRWVLGEQSIKTIRGSKLEDVIFTGTEFRKPVGFAEVALTIDNSEGDLPLEYSEVTISRRFFRSGESEYYINKTPCRLKDINNLFLDTGVGKDGYSIIGQGRIDEILSTKSEDRRNIFEEASGIMKYKVRKEEAEKKLNLTKQNLLRIDDILHELESRLEPLQEQASTARKYLSLRERLKELDINVYLDLISKLKEKIAECDGHYNSVMESKNGLVHKYNLTSNDNENKSKYLKNLEDKLDSCRKEYYALETSLEKNQGELNLNNEKISNLKQNTYRIDNEISNLSNRINKISSILADNDKKLEDFITVHDHLLDDIKKCEQKREEILLTLNTHEKHLETMNSTIMNKLDLLSDKKIQVGNVNSHIESLCKQQQHIENEVRELDLNIAKEIQKKETLEKSIELKIQELNTGMSSLEALISSRKELDSRLSIEKEKKNSVSSDIQVKVSKQKMLKGMEDNLEGYNRTVKAFLQACKKADSTGKGICGALGQLISVKKGYSTAIEMALGGAIQNIVAETEEDAKRAIEFLKKNSMGRATFLPITSVKGNYLDSNILKEVKKCSGFCGVASDLVEYNSEYNSIVLSFLGRVIVVRDLDSGIYMARKFNYSFRIVTLEGDILNTSGAMSGGSRDVNATGILGRTGQISELEEDIHKLNKELIDFEENIKTIISNMEKLSKDISMMQGILKEREMSKLREENQLSNTNMNIKNITAITSMLKQEKEQLIRQQEETRVELHKYISEQEKIEEEISQLKNDIEQYQETQRGNLSERDSIQSELTGYKIAINSAINDINIVKKEIEKLLEEKDAVSRNISDKRNEKAKEERQIEWFNEKNIILSNAIKTCQEEKVGRNIEIDRMAEERKVIEEEVSNASTSMEDISRNISLLNEDLNRLVVKKARSESELDNIQNRLWDEYELTYTNALVLKKDIGSISRAQKEISELKENIKTLGIVNVSAIDEFIKTKERFEFMNEQKTDMENAIENLQKVIHEMNILMEKQFSEKFNLINKNFNMVFKELFGGGTANLRLVDKDNILESGIEIDIQPPGKKLQNMMLLSGGEKAFTAIALLFSILLLKPVSFCVLDEIEASLDDANVSRFASYLKKYSQKTQFIVITHRKGSMEVSDALYGVTMQEKGISKVVSMKIGEKAG